MVATLRVVLDQVVAPTDADLARVARDWRALVATTPGGCEVAAIVPSAPDAAGDLEVPCPDSRT
jgi:hypothetical protein